MLRITVSFPEEWDEEKEEFVYPEARILNLEHSLVSISKWEAKWQKPFISRQKKTTEEIVDYVKCMTLNSNVDSTIYEHLTEDNITEIAAYIRAPMTATKFYNEAPSKPNHASITSETIYYQMIVFGIPVEFENWHLNRLLMLIRVCAYNNRPKKKMKAQDVWRRNAAINEARRKKWHSKG